MEAKDTVMNPEQQRKIISQNREIGMRHFYSAGERLCNRQAEISFNAGKQEGLKEGMQKVVDFVNSNIDMSASNILTWQAFLEGLERHINSPNRSESDTNKDGITT